MLAGYDWIHLVCVVTSTFMVAKNSAEHHYHEVSGKKDVPSKKAVFVSFLYYILTIPARKVEMHILVSTGNENYCNVANS